jgi:hypothetical protein
MIPFYLGDGIWIDCDTGKELKVKDTTIPNKHLVPVGNCSIGQRCLTKHSKAVKVVQKNFGCVDVFVERTGTTVEVPYNYMVMPIDKNVVEFVGV